MFNDVRLYPEEKDGGAKGWRQQTLLRKNNFGFSLPEPIELIELEDRREEDEEDADQDGKEVEGVLPSPIGDPSQSEVEESTSKTDSIIRIEDRDAQADDISPEGRFHEPDAPQNPVKTPWNSVEVHEDAALVMSRQGNTTGGKQTASSEQHGESLPGNSSGAAENGFPAGSSYSSKNDVILGEQEARWLTKDAGASLESRGAPSIDSKSSSSQTDEFRVYPHYIPIPSTAEAPCSPSLLPGDRLQALGRDPQDVGNSIQNQEGAPARPVQPLTLQSQLAIHDLTICWRLFKGRDWVDRPPTATGTWKDRRQADSESSEDRRRLKTKIWQEPDYAADSGSEGHHLDQDGTSKVSSGTPRVRKSELLDALLENYQDGQRHDDGQTGRRGPRQPRQPKVKRLNVLREGRSTRSSKRTGRDTSCMLEILLEHSSLRLDTYHPGLPPSLLSNMLFSIKDIYASDTITSSRPRKMLQHWRDDVRHPREFHQKVVTVRMTARSPSDHFCPEDTPLGDEIMLKVRLLPLHLSFGQYTVDFLRSFIPHVDPSNGKGNSQKGQADKDTTISSISTSTSNSSSSIPFFISCLDVGSCKVCASFVHRVHSCSFVWNFFVYQ